MSLKDTKSNLNHIIDIIDFILNGKGRINKKDSHSDYQNHIYTPEDILGQIKYSATQALKGLDEYK